MIPKRFEVIARCDGRFETIDSLTGRMVEIRDSRRSANGVAQDLNRRAVGMIRRRDYQTQASN